MTDTLWHVLLGLVLANLFAAVVLLTGPHLGAAILAAFWLFTREVTQKQADYGNDIRKGWDFWNWSRSKNLETWVPVGCVLALGFGSAFLR
ncbi:MAG: hypothetical protein SGJ20_06150 [Planctomycetota bacterium]|nr:hypothetical protein [Planctomycetota bacterium]